MPARTLIALLLSVIAAAALTLYLLLGLGMPVAVIGLACAVLAALLRLFPTRR